MVGHAFHCDRTQRVASLAGRIVPSCWALGRHRAMGADVDRRLALAAAHRIIER